MKFTRVGDQINEELLREDPNSFKDCRGLFNDLQKVYGPIYELLSRWETNEGELSPDMNRALDEFEQSLEQATSRAVRLRDALKRGE